MTDTRDDPRYLRMMGLTLLAALLVVASCQVEQLSIIVVDELGVEEASPPTAEVEPSPTSPGVEPPPIIPEQGPATPTDGTQGGDPYFTPMTVRPEITNRGEVQAALIREYPSNLRDAGIGGTVVVWFYITETGQVQDGRISRSSGQQDFDQAALRVASVFRFTPATNRREPVAVWIEVPITFQVIN